MRFHLAWITLALLLPVARAQKPRSQQAPIRSTTRLVEVTAVVRDRNNKFVRNLKMEDFELFDKGTQQTIAVFQSPANRQPAATVELPPGTHTNQPAIAKQPGGVTMVLLDALNTRREDQTFARGQVLAFLSTIRPEDRVAVYVLADKIFVIHDFTSNTASLVQAVKRYRDRPALLNATDVGDLEKEAADAASWLRAGLDRMAIEYTTRRVESTVAAMEAIAHHVAHISGRKNLVWVSSSFPYQVGYEWDRSQYEHELSNEKRMFSAEVQRAARAMNDAGVTIYPVDARGLTATSAFSGVPDRIGRTPPRTTVSTHGPTQDTMVNIAGRTGGVAFMNSNDLAGAIRKVVEEGDEAYVLSFYPTHSEWNGSWRDLRVRVKGQGYHVRHRKGYLALDDPSSSEESVQAQLAATARSPLQALGIGITARLEATPESGKTRINLRIESQDITLREAQGELRGTLEVYIASHGPNGARLTNFSRTLDIRLPLERRADFAREGIRLDSEWALDPAAIDVRIVALEPASGKLGSLAIPLPIKK